MADHAKYRMNILRMCHLLLLLLLLAREEMQESQIYLWNLFHSETVRKVDVEKHNISGVGGPCSTSNGNWKMERIQEGVLEEVAL